MVRLVHDSLDLNQKRFSFMSLLICRFHVQSSIKIISVHYLCQHLLIVSWHYQSSVCYIIINDHIHFYSQWLKTQQYCVSSGRECRCQNCCALQSVDWGFQKWFIFCGNRWQNKKPLNTTGRFIVLEIQTSVHFTVKMWVIYLFAPVYEDLLDSTLANHLHLNTAYTLILQNERGCKMFNWHRILFIYEDRKKIVNVPSQAGNIWI